MHPEVPLVDQAAQRLLATFGPAPSIAVVLGSGLGPLADRLEGARQASFDELGLPNSSVAGHAGRLCVGSLGGVDMAIAQGRIHLYEGHPPDVVVRKVRALRQWGVDKLLLTCSVGGITDGLVPGTMVLVSDHLNLQNANPLVGPAFGTRFPDLTRVYDAAMRQALADVARSHGWDLPSGVLAAMPGPAYETPAEVRMLGILGADIVGMSTVPEVLAAAAVGLRTAVVAVVSNHAAGLSEDPLTHDEVTENAVQVVDRLAVLLSEGARGFGD